MEIPMVRSGDGSVLVNLDNGIAEYKIYLIEYQYEGSSWGLELWATSFEDAEARVRRLSGSKVLGELKVSIPVPTKRFAWVKRLVQRLGKAFSVFS